MYPRPTAGVARGAPYANTSDTFRVLTIFFVLNGGAIASAAGLFAFTGAFTTGFATGLGGTTTTGLGGTTTTGLPGLTGGTDFGGAGGVVGVASNCAITVAIA